MGSQPPGTQVASPQGLEHPMSRLSSMLYNRNHQSAAGTPTRMTNENGPPPGSSKPNTNQVARVNAYSLNDFYHILNVESTATIADIRRTYCSLTLSVRTNRANDLAAVEAGKSE
jgi:hypothetical protein